MCWGISLCVFSSVRASFHFCSPSKAEEVISSSFRKCENILPPPARGLLVMFTHIYSSFSSTLCFFFWRPSPLVEPEVQKAGVAILSLVL